MKAVSIMVLAWVCAVGAVQAQQPQPLPMPAAETPALPAPQDIDYPGVIDLHVDASDIDRHIIRIREVIPVAKSGPMTVLAPQWLPGAHSPRDSDLSKIAGIRIMAGDRELKWRRDNVAMHAFHFEVPEGTTEVTVYFQYLSPVVADEGVVVHTRDMLTLQWEKESLYPAGYFARRIPVRVILTLPQGWQYGTALETGTRQGDVVTFEPISYDNLIDSPLIAGRYFKRYDLDPGAKVPVWMDVVGDTPADTEVPENVIAMHRKVVDEAYHLFGGWHYDHYNFLVAVSTEMGGIGLEHARSSENGVEPGYFTEVAGKGYGRNILPHEYIHSWDGKFRRPHGQFTADFQQPMRDELLWVYEGGTSYWGEIVESRSGLYSFEQRLEMLANTAAGFAILPGRQWRDLVDTTYDPIISNREPKAWSNWQRAEDYYSEGALIWLDADTLIREKTGGRKSLDDFARAFFGMHNGSYLPSTYTFDDVVQTLNSVLPYDWKTFLETRITRTGKGTAPLDGLARGGYRLVYTDTPNGYIASREAKTGGANLMTSLGLSLRKDGTIGEVLWDGPGFKAGLSKGMKVVAVNSRAYDGRRLKETIKAARDGKTPINLMILDGEVYRTVSFDYRDGLRYPHLERIAGAKDWLSDIYAAKTGKSR